MKNRALLITLLVCLLLGGFVGCGSKSKNIQNRDDGTEVEMENLDDSKLIERLEVSQEPAGGEKRTEEYESNITDDNIQETQRFDSLVDSISLDETKKYDEQIDFLYDEIKKIVDDNDFLVDGITKVENGVVIKFESGIKYYYPVSTVDRKEGGKKLHISTQQPYNTSGEQALPNDQTDKIAMEIETNVEDTVFDLNVDDSQVDFSMLYRIFSRDSVIIWDGHGGWDNASNVFVLPLGENSWGAVYESQMLKYEAENGNIYICPGDRLAITAACIDDMDLNLKNSAIFLDTCYSMKDAEFAEALINKGATLIYGYSDSVSVKYGDSVLYCILEEMIQTDEAGYKDFASAGSVALGKFGLCDPYTEVQAEPRGCGDYGYRFNVALENAVFEPEEKILDSLEDGRYFAFDNPMSENPELDERGTFTQAEIVDGVLEIRSSFEQWNDDWSNCTLYPYGLRKMKVSDDILIQHSGGAEGPELDTIEGFNSQYSDISSQNRLNYAGLSIGIFIENGEVVKIDIGS